MVTLYIPLLILVNGAGPCVSAVPLLSDSTNPSIARYRATELLFDTQVDEIMATRGGESSSSKRRRINRKIDWFRASNGVEFTLKSELKTGTSSVIHTATLDGDSGGNNEYIVKYSNDCYERATGRRQAGQDSLTTVKEAVILSILNDSDISPKIYGFSSPIEYKSSMKIHAE